MFLSIAGFSVSWGTDTLFKSVRYLHRQTRHLKWFLIVKGVGFESVDDRFPDARDLKFSVL